MKIRIDDIGEEETEVEFKTGLAEINQALANPTATDFRFEPEAEVTMRHYRVASDLFFNAHIDAEASGTCARCLETYPVELDCDVSWVMKPAGSVERARSEHDADAALAFYDGDEVDLDPFVREELMVTLPTRALCAEDCRGLCSHCGGNLNKRACGCDATEVSSDPRLAVLREWKPSRS